MTASFRLRVIRPCVSFSYSQVCPRGYFHSLVGVDWLMSLRSKLWSPESTQAVQSRFANVNGVRLHYLDSGTGAR
jgi:hypothetical protein